MKNKILKIILCFVLTSTVFLSLAIPSFAFFDTSLIGAPNFTPNCPSPTVNYLSDSSTSSNPGRFSLNGYVSYAGGSNSSRNAAGNTSRTYHNSTNDVFGYQFGLAYAAEVFINFGYLRFREAYLPLSDRFSIYLNVSFDDTLSLIPNDREVMTVITTYYDDNFQLQTDSWYLSMTSGRTNLFDMIDFGCKGIVAIQFGFNATQWYEGESYDNAPTLNVNVEISNFSDWKRLDPYKNSSENFFLDSYNHGYNTAILELDGGSLNDAFNRGYENGYSFGYQQGQIGEYNKGFDAGKNQGIAEGYATGQQSGYNQGYATGLAQLGPEKLASYNQGYEEGRNVGISEGQQIGYWEGYEEGYDIGHDDGYYQGYDSGVADDRDRAYQEGYYEGEGVGYANGFNDGVTDGLRWGEEEGYQVGYQEGYDVGVAESIEEMGLFNFIVASVGSVLSIPLGEHFTLGGILAIIVAIPLLALMLKLFSGGD